ncbi:MAG: hypothetical protein KF729_29460 [Sandaracinaceae bacterium]|nr:hypothetical protein [Sandaracinaceae bacterium]
MGARARTLLSTSLLVFGCGGGDPAPAPATAGDEASRAEATSAAEPTSATTPALRRLDEQVMLTYEVRLDDAPAPIEVRMVVQQRILRGRAVAVRLVPIGTPLGEEPVYPQWLVATPEALSGLEETASLTTPGFVPIDERGALRTEAASAQLWRLEARWLRAGEASGGTEAAVGWTLVERVGAITEPVAASDCVRLERGDDTASSTLLVCADVGVVERQDAAESRAVAWRLTAVGVRPQELE